MLSYNIRKHYSYISKEYIWIMFTYMKNDHKNICLRNFRRSFFCVIPLNRPLHRRKNYLFLILILKRAQFSIYIWSPNPMGHPLNLPKPKFKTDEKLVVLYFLFEWTWKFFLRKYTKHICLIFLWNASYDFY